MILLTLQSHLNRNNPTDDITFKVCTEKKIKSLDLVNEAVDTHSRTPPATASS